MAMGVGVMRAAVLLISARKEDSLVRDAILQPTFPEMSLIRQEILFDAGVRSAVSSC